MLQPYPPFFLHPAQFMVRLFLGGEIRFWSLRLARKARQEGHFPPVTDCLGTIPGWRTRRSNERLLMGSVPPIVSRISTSTAWSLSAPTGNALTTTTNNYGSAAPTSGA